MRLITSLQANLYFELIFALPTWREEERDTVETEFGELTSDCKKAWEVEANDRKALLLYSQRKFICIPGFALFQEKYISISLRPNFC